MDFFKSENNADKTCRFINLFGAHMEINLSDKVKIDSEMNVLIIEDSEELCEVLQLSLKSFGFLGEIYIAKNLEESIKIINSVKIDLFIIDWLLPDGEGVMLVKKLRSFKEYKYVPVLMITGRSDLMRQSEFVDYGIGGLLIKPFEVSDFKNSLIKLFELKENSIAKIPSESKFLVIDDERDFVFLMENYLNKLGFKNISKAYSCKEAEEKLNSENIEIVITDWTLPDGSGIELIEKLRRLEKFKKLPILVVTGRDSIDDIIDLNNHQVKDHIIKPFPLTELETKLADCYLRNKS